MLTEFSQLHSNPFNPRPALPFSRRPECFKPSRPKFSTPQKVLHSIPSHVAILANEELHRLYSKGVCGRHGVWVWVGEGEEGEGAASIRRVCAGPPSARPLDAHDDRTAATTAHTHTESALRAGASARKRHLVQVQSTRRGCVVRRCTVRARMYVWARRLDRHDERAVPTSRRVHATRRGEAERGGCDGNGEGKGRGGKGQGRERERGGEDGDGRMGGERGEGVGGETRECAVASLRRTPRKLDSTHTTNAQQRHPHAHGVRAETGCERAQTAPGTVPAAVDSARLLVPILARPAQTRSARTNISVGARGESAHTTNARQRHLHAHGVRAERGLPGARGCTRVRLRRCTRRRLEAHGVPAHTRQQYLAAGAGALCGGAHEGGADVLEYREWGKGQGEGRRMGEDTGRSAQRTRATWGKHTAGDSAGGGSARCSGGGIDGIRTWDSTRMEPWAVGR
ncbi:hypothetical protein B0H16DRAFT_1698775 [Mycena metata]|uniref:Uncharacterized protein n=1 Tax=Mycena metata TaxID=1033252 RepID=A0AAD7HN88_9AGAR|nr:hypothetical protein B0H16DRAFT_1698775 [Mycena metata]